MKNQKLRRIIFLALCCDLSLIAKRIISPAANILTDFLRIPGGIGTGFSLMFLVLAAILTPGFGCAAIMGAVQSIIAISLGMMGSMGVLSPIGYIFPGVVIDCAVYLANKSNMSDEITALLSNALASTAACLAANLIVFRLKGLVLTLYLSVAVTSGMIFGHLCGKLLRRLRPVICPERPAASRPAGQKKWICCMMLLAAALTAVLSVGRIRGSQSDGILIVNNNGTVCCAELDQIELDEVFCVVMSGKNEEKQITAQGISLKALAPGDFESVTVTANDGYNADVLSEEAAGAFLIIDENGTASLVVSGDQSAKRHVQNVRKVEYK